MFLIAAIAIHSLGIETIKKIVLAGADVLRFNFAYSSVPVQLQRIKMAIEIIEELNSSVKILIDLPPNRIRLGDFDIKIFAVREGEEFVFKSSSFSPDCNEFIPVNVQRLGEKTHVNQMITMGDGEIAVEVTQIINTDTIKAKILNNGILQAMKGFNIESSPTENGFLNNYKKMIHEVAEVSPDFIAISYVTPAINEEIKKIIPAERNYKLIIKIEDRATLDNLDKIMSDSFYDTVLLDRGELAINTPYEQLGIYQKKITQLAKQNKKTFIVSTQILESTINNFIPLRSDILDLTNMVLDGVDGIMFCRETGINKRPSYTISVAKKIIRAVTNAKNNGMYEIDKI